MLDEILDPAYYDYSSEPRNREGLERLLAITNTAFPGHETIIEEMICEGDTVAVCETFRGTHSGPFRGFPASGKAFEVGRYRFLKVTGGQDHFTPRINRSPSSAQTEVQDTFPIPIHGVISDGQHSIRNAVATAFPEIPHQLCHFH